MAAIILFNRQKVYHSASDVQNHPEAPLKKSTDKTLTLVPLGYVVKKSETGTAIPDENARKECPLEFMAKNRDRPACGAPTDVIFC